ncbi:hypothetical protein CVT24_011685 [Panaeolus cyanescens]|uniref:TauD/TfdA-like domain-containing protein n=1 Tax=Panaeolus cyanescens TaxID=181874 RepID=A0A409YH43_9AGAR|nr:hypothetical protein CVT24_011685 [Panaeolus cyanescens]
MPPSFQPIPLPPSADPAHFVDFGREVADVNPGNLSQEDFKQIEEALYKYDVLLFRNAQLTPEELYTLVKAFDPQSTHYAHGNKQLDGTKKNILYGYVHALPHTPQVQIIGNGIVRNHEGIDEIQLKHGRHPEFHKTRISEEDEANGFTRFFRWHMDAALYRLEPPRVTALYGLKVPKGPMQTVRYDDGSGDELQVTLGTTAFVSGKTMFNILPNNLKNLVVRAKAKYPPHPFQWVRDAKAVSTGLGMESDGLEVPLDDLPAWEEKEVKIYPFVWKNPVTGELHLMVHPCLVMEVHVDPVPLGCVKEGALYPDGACLKDLEDIRKLLYQIQRPGIDPKAITNQLVYPHPWEENDLVLFNNRGLLHSVVGVFTKDQVRLFHQCNLAGSDAPIGPSKEDIETWCSG